MVGENVVDLKGDQLNFYIMGDLLSLKKHCPINTDINKRHNQIKSKLESG